MQKDERKGKPIRLCMHIHAKIHHLLELPYKVFLSPHSNWLQEDSMLQTLEDVSWLCLDYHQLGPTTKDIIPLNNGFYLIWLYEEIECIRTWTWLRLSTRFTISSSGQSKKRTIFGSAPICIWNNTGYVSYKLYHKLVMTNDLVWNGIIPAPYTLTRVFIPDLFHFLFYPFTKIITLLTFPCRCKNVFIDQKYILEGKVPGQSWVHLIIMMNGEKFYFFFFLF